MAVAHRYRREIHCAITQMHQQRANADANCRRLIYELDQRGIHLLQQHGGEFVQRTRPPANFAHELMVCQIMASFELGARERAVRLITWNDILASESLPDQTRCSSKPHSVPVRFEGTTVSIAADGQPFGIARSDNHGSAYFFCPGIEADCGTDRGIVFCDDLTVHFHAALIDQPFGFIRTFCDFAFDQDSQDGFGWVRCSFNSVNLSRPNG